MSYSCTQKAARAYESIMAHAGHTLSNSYTNPRGVTCHVEEPGQENSDGAIHRTVYIACDVRWTIQPGGKYAKPCGTVKIAPDGKIESWPQASVKMRRAIRRHNATLAAFARGEKFVVA